MEQSELNQTIVEALEAQQTKIMAGMNAEEGRREECRESERGLNIKYILSEFQGGTSLIRYMNQLNQYWEAVKPRDNDTHYLTERSLSEPPGVWWQIIKDEVSNLQTFLNKFSRRFWNEQAQHELRRKLEFDVIRRERRVPEQNMQFIYSKRTTSCNVTE